MPATCMRNIPVIHQKLRLHYRERPYKGLLLPDKDSRTVYKEKSERIFENGLGTHARRFGVVWAPGFWNFGR